MDLDHIVVPISRTSNLSHGTYSLSAGAAVRLLLGALKDLQDATWLPPLALTQTATLDKFPARLEQFLKTPSLQSSHITLAICGKSNPCTID